MKVDKEFYLCDGLQLSRKLIGKVLCRQTDSGLLRARIIETEAYMGSGDKAAHASKGKTNRTSVLFEEGGKAYIYLIYGMYCCLNISANIAEVPDCVLIRSAEPLDGVQQMCMNRNTENLFNLCSGPGKLCQAFSLTKHDNATDLDSDRLWIEDDGFTVDMIAVSKRINIDYAQEAIDFPWRFYIPESRYLSVKIKK